MSEYETGRCVIGGKEHGADVGYVCAHHLQRMSTTLREIEDQAAMLSAVPSMQQQTGNRGGGIASHRAPARLDVIVHTDRRRGTGIPLTGEPDPVGWDETPSVLDVLHSWARVVREERDLTTSEPMVTITGERRLLTTHLDWIAAQEWVDEFYVEIHDLLGRLKAANGTQGDKPVGKCPTIVDGEECGGSIRQHDFPTQVWRTYADRCVVDNVRAPIGTAYCDRCWRAWEGADLARLMVILEWDRRPKDENGDPLWTAAEVAAEHKVKPSTINVWAHRRRIVSINGYWDPRAFRKKAST